MSEPRLDPPDFWDIHRRDCPLHESKPWRRDAACKCADHARQDKDDIAEAE